MNVQTLSAPPQRTAESPSSRARSLRRQLPIGAELLDGRVHFRVWAPKCHEVSVLLGREPALEETSSKLFHLEREPDGYFSGLVEDATGGMFYKFKLPAGAFPDPASRFQPQGPHGPSQLINPNQFQWSDASWPGLPRERQVIYEMHIGTFTPEGTWTAAEKQLPHLADLGITTLEIMPVADFPGKFGWGYDGVNFFAPTRLYGQPDDFRKFINRAHGLGLGVILDVVYNHFGPDGNYLNQFSDDYFTDRHQNEWGQALNFDGENCIPAREFFISNAIYWIKEFHLDGLRLDATQQIFDDSSEHILSVIAQRCREAAGPRSIYIVAENESQHTRLVREPSQGGYGLDALWNDDFHHSAFVALTGRSEAYYSDHRGSPQEFISALKWGYLFQGQWYSWQKKGRGTPALDLDPARFVNYLENHDQIANSLRGLRLHQLSSPAQYRALTALLLLGPAAPMLFQGQEFATSSPFLYFAEHNPDLAKLVSKGRKEFLHQFSSITTPEAESCISEPAAEQTFLRCKLDFSERNKNEPISRLHKDLLRLRREDPVFSRQRPCGLEGAVLGPESFVLRFFGEQDDARLLLVNLGADVRLEPIPEPLLAPPAGSNWEVLWSSENPCYGGCGSAPVPTSGPWLLPAHAALALRPVPETPSKNGKVDSQS